MYAIRFVFSATQIEVFNATDMYACLLDLGSLLDLFFECYSDWGFECHMPKWNPLIKKLFDSLVYKCVHNM